MITRTGIVDHTARRLVVALPAPYEAAREHYEALVPEIDLDRFHGMTSWQATLELAETNAPHAFMRYYRSDITAVMTGSVSDWRATQYLMGNHTIAERMYRYDPSVMLHAPLRALLYNDSDGDTKFAIDQPSLLFASYGDPRITGVGRELDAHLAELVRLLGGEVPPQLTP
ncbi:hypothetical protein ABZ642_09755 [Streptomyces sp. NPDC007157]|uniref:hypothetical protein n=1 Tax=Streptomyces sp. NPDC007157 TaxID=3154681 RepID=UPI0033FA2840